MYDRKLEFDSKKFKLQIIKWEDVQQLISQSETSINIEGKGKVVGKLYIHDDIIILSNEDESLELERNNIISLTNGTDGELSYWLGKISLGLSVSN
ncbi:hypothetical protein JHD50_06235 [Sulfurimonas sp. MAG313]|nr:hypothetical protein [Sulfurimonas sp. MAG313]MDF1880906.1 hypothetical protein [Sulfurimonas sp. MAG313]